MQHSTRAAGSAPAAARHRGWSVIVPIKRPPDAKTRLLPATVPAERRVELVLALAADTVRAVLDCPAVSEVLVVTEDDQVAESSAGLGARIVVERLDPALTGHPRLNAAIELAEPFAALPRAVLTADLAALDPAELAVVLDAAAGHRRSFLPDRHGTGTALLAATTGSLAPAFGLESAQAHEASGAVPLHVRAPSVRLDIDDPDDLRAAVRLGVGPATRKVLQTGDDG